MIRYQLICDQEHETEAWFASSDAFSQQRKRGLLECPMCNSREINQTLMAPAIKTLKEKKENLQTEPELLNALRKLRDYVKKNAHYVGKNFAEEARKIHLQETQARDIYGETSCQEAKELYEEGIPVTLLPCSPEDMN